MSVPPVPLRASPGVLSEDETIEAVLAGRSLARFGDGELKLCVAKNCVSQLYTPEVMVALQTVLADPGGPCLIAIPNFAATPLKHWANYNQPYYMQHLGVGGAYGSSFISRPDSAPWIDRPDYWAKVRHIWADRHAVLVTGDDGALSPEMMDGVASVTRVTVPRSDAFGEIDAIQARIGTAAYGKSNPLIILCAGATGTVLAHRLAGQGVQAADLGHIGLFMRHAGAYAFRPADLASPEYRATLAAHRKGGKRWGADGAKHRDAVLAYSQVLGARAILDYGCGEGELAKSLIGSGVRVYGYDPGIPGLDDLPKPQALVVSTDVLEHVEPDRLEEVLVHMRRLAGKGAYLVISTKPANAILPDGRNAHLIVESADWWHGTLARIGWTIEKSEDSKGEVRLWLRK